MRHLLCRHHSDGKLMRIPYLTSAWPVRLEIVLETDNLWQVRIRCAEDICGEYDLCVPCFSEGKHSSKHDPATHSYQVIEQHSIPIFTEDWGADEELLLLEGAETYGLGSWADIADHIGGYRSKDEVRDHYINTYINSSLFPLPEKASPEDTSLSDEIPRDEFQARKKRRIEKRKDDAKNAAPLDPKQKPTSSVPSCHEVQGFMPGRLEFEQEWLNDAEEAVQHMQFEPGDGIDPRTGQLDAETDLKLTVMDIYNHRLTARLERKRVILEHNLLEYRKNAAIDKKKTKDERDLSNKIRPFARMMNRDDFDTFSQSIEYEHDLRTAIHQLQEWRRMQVTTLKDGERYEQDKAQRLARFAAGSIDRFAVSSRPRPSAALEPQPASTKLLDPDLPLKSPRETRYTDERKKSVQGKPLTNGDVNGLNGVVKPEHEPDFDPQPLEKLKGPEPQNDTPDWQLLSKNEQKICKTYRIYPKPYTVMKDAVLREALRNNGLLKKKTCREICRIDTQKANKLFDFWAWSGWIGKA